VNIMYDAYSIKKLPFFFFKTKHKKLLWLSILLLRLFDAEGEEGKEGEVVAVEAEAGDDALADGR